MPSPRRTPTETEALAREVCRLALEGNRTPAQVAEELVSRHGTAANISERYVRLLIDKALTEPLVRVEVHDVAKGSPTLDEVTADVVANRFGLEHVRVLATDHVLDPRDNPESRLELYRALGRAGADLLLDPDVGIRDGEVIGVGGGRAPALLSESVSIPPDRTPNAFVVSLGGASGRAPTVLRDTLDPDSVATRLAMNLRLSALEDREELAGNNVYPRLSLLSAPLFSRRGHARAEQTVKDLLIEKRNLTMVCYGMGVVDLDFHVRPHSYRMTNAVPEVAQNFAKLQHISTVRNGVVVVELVGRFYVASERFQPSEALVDDARALCSTLNQSVIALPADQIAEQRSDVQTLRQRRLLIAGGKSKATALLSILETEDFPAAVASVPRELRPTHLVIDRPAALELLALDSRQ